MFPFFSVASAQERPLQPGRGDSHWEGARQQNDQNLIQTHLGLVYTVVTVSTETTHREAVFMIQQKLRKAGNSYVITIPKDEIQAHGWQAGQRFAVQLTLLEERPALPRELREALDESWNSNQAGYQYLADR